MTGSPVRWGRSPPGRRSRASPGRPLLPSFLKASGSLSRREPPPRRGRRQLEVRGRAASETPWPSFGAAKVPGAGAALRPLVVCGFIF